MAGRCVSIHVRDTDLRVRGCQLTIGHHTSLAGEITATAMTLFAQRDYARMLPLRSIGVSVSSLADAHDPLQMDLFGDAARRDRQLRLDSAVDVIKRRFGSKAVIRGNVLAHPLFSVLDPYTNNTIHPVPFYVGQ
jgi:DNA polymerase-4